MVSWSGLERMSLQIARHTHSICDLFLFVWAVRCKVSSLPGWGRVSYHVVQDSCFGYQNICSIFSIALTCMGDLSARSLWRIRLCPYGSQCSDWHCAHAHELSELRPPMEAFGRHDQVWREGVDRWYGQALSDEQINLLLRYYHETPFYMVPLWTHGLFYVLRRQNYVEHLHFPWDYGICSDI